MLEKTKLKMLSDSQAKQYADGNYFEMFSLREGSDVIGFVSIYSKESGFVSIGLDIRKQYRHQQLYGPGLQRRVVHGDQRQ